jgi:hypothetical protein
MSVVLSQSKVVGLTVGLAHGAAELAGGAVTQTIGVAGKLLNEAATDVTKVAGGAATQTIKTGRLLNEAATDATNVAGGAATQTIKGLEEASARVARMAHRVPFLPSRESFESAKWMSRKVEERVPTHLDGDLTEREQPTSSEEGKQLTRTG